jgi:hypothetical protein
MGFNSKYKSTNGKTKHIRIPEEYLDVIQKLMEVFDKRFTPEQGKHILHKFINNFE